MAEKGSFDIGNFSADELYLGSYESMLVLSTAVSLLRSHVGINTALVDGVLNLAEVLIDDKAIQNRLGLNKMAEYHELSPEKHQQLRDHFMDQAKQVIYLNGGQN